MFNPQMERTTDDDVVAQGLRAARFPVRKLSRHEELLADITAEDAKIARLDAALWALWGASSPPPPLVYDALKEVGISADNAHQVAEAVGHWEIKRGGGGGGEGGGGGGGGGGRGREGEAGQDGVGPGACSSGWLAWGGAIMLVLALLSLSWLWQVLQRLPPRP